MAGAAEVIRLMMNGGQGDRVLDVWARIAPAGGNNGAGNGSEDGNGSALSAALGRLPGGHGAPETRRLGNDRPDSGASAGVAHDRPADCQSAGAPFGGLDGLAVPGQMPLVVDSPPVLPGGEPASAPAGQPAAAPGPTPTPPSGQTREDIHPHGADFDFLKCPDRDEVTG